MTPTEIRAQEYLLTHIGSRVGLMAGFAEEERKIMSLRDEKVGAKTMTKNETLITRCQSLPKGESIYGCPDDPNGAHYTSLTTDHIIHLANELDRAEKALTTIRIIAADHIELGHECPLCLIDGYASGELKPLAG